MIEKYKSGKCFQKKYRSERQVYLKERVLNTYAVLLEAFANTDIYKNKTILDTGSADGSFEIVCKSRRIPCRSIDVDHGINFERDRLPFADGEFDIVNSNSVIEHLFDPSNYMQEIHRILKPGGYLIVVTPHWPYTAKDFFNTFTHVHPYSYRALNECFIAFGFKSLALVPWLVMKPVIFWKIPKPFCFVFAKYCLLFNGTTKWVPSFLKGKSSTLLGLAQKV